MTSPDLAHPGGSQLASSIGSFYQNANQSALGASENAWLLQVAEEFREAVFGMLGGFGDVAEVVWDGIQALIEALTGGGGSLDDVVDWVATLGAAVGDLLQGVIPIGWLSASTPNLLANPGFDGAASMVAGEGWIHDPAVGRTAVGSARFDGAGIRGVQQSTPVQVAEGHVLDAEAYAKWSGITGASAMFKVAVRWWDDDTMIAETIVATQASPGTSGGWAKLAGQATTPAGANLATIALIVEDTVTAGSIWWDDAALRKPAKSIPQQWVTGLIDALGDLGDLIEHIVDQILTSLGLPTLGSIGDRILDLADELGDMLDIGQANAAGLDDLLGDLLNAPQTVLGMIPKIKIAGLTEIEDTVVDLQSKTQELADVVGFACRYMATSPGVSTSPSVMPFDVQVGPYVGVTLQPSGRFRLDSKGLWELNAQVRFWGAKWAPPKCFMDIVVRDPGGTEIARLKSIQSSEDELTIPNAMPVVIPSAGCTVEVVAWTSAIPIIGGNWRGIGGGLGTTRFWVKKMSSETS